MARGRLEVWDRISSEALNYDRQHLLMQESQQMETKHTTPKGSQQNPGPYSRHWSAEVTRPNTQSACKTATCTTTATDTNSAMSFKTTDPWKIAASLKRSAEANRRRNSVPLQSAMSVLSAYLSRPVRSPSGPRRHILEQAMDNLRMSVRPG